jgi:hypothetical protein
VRDHIHRYSLLGAGMKGEDDRCPQDEFVYQLPGVGDQKKVTFTGSNISCSKMAVAKCGSPSFEVKT